jgi:PAS domain S-box-containing protein
MPRDQKRPDLSEREQQLLDLAAQGYTDTAIANELGISEATVGTYWGRIRIKLGPYNRTELVAIALREESEKELTELRIENERLREQMRIETGGDAERPNVNFYRGVIENAADAILLVNEQGVIEVGNEAACALFGYDKGELDGCPVSILLPERYRMIHDSHREEYLRHPEKKQMGEHASTLAVRKTGEEFSIAASLSANLTSTGTVITCIVRDMSHVRRY